MHKNKIKQNQADLDALFELMNEVGIINQLASTKFSQALPTGLTQPQFSVLNNFSRLGGTRSPAQLALAFQVTKGAMTNTLKRLDKKNYVKIIPDPDDGRGKSVSITPAGRRARDKAIASVQVELGELARIIEKDLLDVVLPKLRILRAQLDHERNLDG